MTALTGIMLANFSHRTFPRGTMLSFVAYTKDMERLPMLAVWPQAARPGKP